VVAVCPLLVERERELGFLVRVAEAVAAGPSQLVVLTGEAGTGKSRLAAELVAGLGRDWRTVRLAVESGFPVPAQGSSGPNRDGDVDWVATTSAATEGTPTIVVIEDAERLDPAGVVALAAATDRFADHHVLTIAQVRLGAHAPGSEFGAELADLLRKSYAHELAVGPLSANGLAAMAAALGHTLDSGRVRDLWARTGGNAFFSEEILLSDDDSLPWTVTDAVTRRLQSVPPAAQTTAELLAVAADPISRSTLDDLVVQCDDRDDDDGVTTLLDAGIARQDELGRVMLRHALVGEVVAARLSGRDRRRLNALLAVALEADGEPAERLARHWRDADDPVRAADYAAAAAGDAAAHGAHRTAADLYRLALAAPPDDPFERAGLFERAAVESGWAGMGQEAMELAGAADAAYRAAGADAQAVAVWLQPGLSHIPKPQLDYRLLDRDGVERLLEEARTAAQERDHERSAGLARQALEMVGSTPDRAGWIIRGARRLIGCGYLAEGEAHLRRLRGIATATGDRALLASSLGALASTALARGQLEDSLALDREAVATARGSAEAAAWTFECGVATLLAYRGDLDEATTDVDALVAVGVPMITEFAQLGACVVDIERGDLARASSRLERLAAVTLLQVDELTAGVLLARARWEYDSGDAERALTTLDEADAVTGDVLETTRTPRLVLHARAGDRADRPGIVSQVHLELVRMADLCPGPGLEAPRDWVAALIDAREGRHDEAARRFAAVADVWERLGWVIAAADAWIDTATSARCAGDTDGEAMAMVRAEQLARPRGLTRVLTRLATIAPPGPDAPSLHPSPLTARERQIAELVAAGKTNREIADQLFISPHTVRNQLVRIFDKLGVSRRSELASAIAKADDEPA
jgi:DNA-binding CsgD family transcriptional regulator/tetratricopeptide (TPR) repeat protein